MASSQLLILLGIFVLVRAYDYQQPSRILTRVSDESERHPGTFVYSSEMPPTSNSEIAALVDNNQLTHGDVLRFRGDRDTFSQIVFYSEAGHFLLLANPDDAAAGYLTMPRRVMENVIDFQVKFAEAIEESAFINFHLSPRDRYIEGLFGGRAEVDWDYDVSFQFGVMEGYIYITPPGRRAGEFRITGLTWDDVLQYHDV